LAKKGNFARVLKEDATAHLAREKKDTNIQLVAGKKYTGIRIVLQLNVLVFP
jgi:hypothetical protein